ncbi:MAG: polymer-forming cytoskeletal protein [Bacteroidales bacterium]|jgi:cytoskeletal protein CcmA (bactofilin family)|nr:polymer-forming cytoskeletal protein [Bacteroidales bacterium]
MAKFYEQDGVANVNIIATGTTITGDIITSGDCRIDGMIKGNIVSKAKLIVGVQGTVDGDIRCQSFDLEGKATGTILVEELMTLRAQSKLTGNITVGKIAIEAGAEFAGSCKMHNSAETVSTPGPTTQPANLIHSKPTA